MSPIYVPPTPVPIIRQRIRNQADIQEELRAYNPELQQTVGANAAAFEANNIGRKTTLFAEPVYAEPATLLARQRFEAEQRARAAKERRQEAQEEESKQREAEAEERRAQEEAEFQRKKELSRKTVDPATMGFGEPARKRGRPAAGTRGTRKLKEDLKKDILSSGTGSLPENFDDLYLTALQRLAEERGISIVYE